MIALLAAALVALMPCNPQTMDCRLPYFEPVWMRFEDVTGEPFWLNAGRIEATNQGGAVASIYIGSTRGGLDLRRVHQLYFDCQGSVEDMNSRTTVDAPPRSVVGQIARVACSRTAAERARRRDFCWSSVPGLCEKEGQRQAVLPPPPKPDPVYCEGFSAEACGRIQAGVEAKVAPPYCAPGFAQNPNLNLEQYRICYARPR